MLPKGAGTQLIAGMYQVKTKKAANIIPRDIINNVKPQVIGDNL